MNFKLKTAATAALSAGALAGVLMASAQTTPTCFQFTQNLKLGSTGAQVLQLQKSLNSLGFTVSASGAGSAGNETSYFGNATKNAVIKFQEAHVAEVLAPFGLTKGTGNFYSATRAYINANCGSGGSTTNPTNPTTPSTGGVAVSLSSVQPNNVLVAGQAHAKLADFTFSGTGIVTGVKLQRTGISNNSTLANVYLYDGATRISDAASVLVDGSVNFNYGTGLFSVTGSKTISVYADIAAGTSGQSTGVSLTGYTVSGSAAAVVSGVNGPALPIGSATLASTTVTFTSSQSTADVGNQNVNVWGGTLNVTKDVFLNGANFKMIGSAPTTALTNVKLYIDGVQVGNASMVDSMGRISFSGNNSIKAGNHTINVRGDIADGAGRSFYITLEQGSDLMVQDAQLPGIYSMPVLSPSTFNLVGATLSINSCSSGCVILSPDSSFTAQKVVVGATNQTIGKFTLTALGEPVKLMSANLDITGTVTASSSESVSNVQVYVNGMAVTSGGTDALNVSTLALSNMGGIIVNPGTAASIEVRADLRSTSGTNISGQNLTASFSNFTVQGQQSRNTSTSSQSSNIVTAGGLTATFSKNASFSGSSIPATQSGVKIGSYTMSTGANEGVTVSQIDLTLTPSGINLGNISNLILKDEAGAVLGQRGSIGSGVTPSNQQFSMYVPVGANSTKTFEFFADFVNAATGTVVTTAVGTYQGQLGLTTATGSGAAASTTVGISGISGTATLIGSQSQAAQYVVGGTVSPVASFEFKATDSDVTANTVEVVVSNPASVGGVTIDGNVAVSNGNGRYTASVNKVITKLGTIIPVGVTFVQADTNNNLSNATTSVGVAYIGTNTNGATFGTQGTTTASVSSNVFTSAISIPTAVKAAGVYLGTGNQTNIKLGTLTITAASNGAIKIATSSVVLGAPSGTATATKLKISGTDYANIASGIATFTSPYIISAGQTVTFDVYGDANVTGSAGNTSVNPGTTFDFSDLTANHFTDTTKIKNYGN